MRERHSSRVLLLRQLEVPERVGLEEEPSPLVPGLRGPVEHREQEPQVGLDRAIGHGPAAATWRNAIGLGWGLAGIDVIVGGC